MNTIILFSSFRILLIHLKYKSFSFILWHSTPSLFLSLILLLWFSPHHLLRIMQMLPNNTRASSFNLFQSILHITARGTIQIYYSDHGLIMLLFCLKPFNNPFLCSKIQQISPFMKWFLPTLPLSFPTTIHTPATYWMPCFLEQTMFSHIFITLCILSPWFRQNAIFNLCWVLSSHPWLRARTQELDLLGLNFSSTICKLCEHGQSHLISLFFCPFNYKIDITREFVWVIERI